MKAFDEYTAARLADLFATLGDPSRLRVIDCLLSGEQSVGQTAEILGMSESAVSHQLQRLRVMRLVRSRKQGRRIFYSLDDDHVTRLFQLGLDHVLHG
jgi:ArsR family transcriptional regulator, lead/cadmium/zinc/bismuth-responsive transcriptional repressor